MYALALLAQAQSSIDNLSFVGVLLYAFLPGISSFLAMYAYSGFKTILPWYDKLPAKVHMIVAPAVQFLFGYYLVAKLGVGSVVGLDGLDLEWWNATLTTLGSAGLFRFFKRTAPVDATITMQTTRKSQPLPEAL